MPRRTNTHDSLGRSVVGWVERSETHHPRAPSPMGFAAAQPNLREDGSSICNNRVSQLLLHHHPRQTPASVLICGKCLSQIAHGKKMKQAFKAELKAQPLYVVEIAPNASPPTASASARNAGSLLRVRRR